MIKMEVEALREKEKEEYEEERRTREMECEVKTQKRALKRKLKKEKAKAIKEAVKKGGIKNVQLGDGTFLERVREKYGEDALVHKEDDQDSEGSGDHEDSESEESVGPKFEEVK